MQEADHVGVFLCWKGTLPPESIDLKSLAAYARGLPHVVAVRDLRTDPVSTPDALRREIQAHRLTRVVLAGDSPGYYKQAFTRALAEAGGDPAEVRLASFREHGAQYSSAKERAKAVTCCAVLGVPYGLAAVPATTQVHPDTLVIGGGVAGIQVSLEIADAGKKVYLIERTGTIGGHMAIDRKSVV